jgi:hypothetical protein
MILLSKTCLLEFVPSIIFKNNNLPFYTHYRQKNLITLLHRKINKYYAKGKNK